MRRMLVSIVVAGASLVSSTENAESKRLPLTPEQLEEEQRRFELRPQLQIDGGLSVIGLAYEHPITARLAIAPEAFVFGTYFLPWFDLGDRIVAVGGGVRVTWFARDDGRGLYVTPYVRAARGDGSMAVTTGAFVGWAFGLSDRVDLRLGAGAQYIYISDDRASTPFVAIDGVVGYRF